MWTINGQKVSYQQLNMVAFLTDKKQASTEELLEHWPFRTPEAGNKKILLEWLKQLKDLGLISGSPKKGWTAQNWLTVVIVEAIKWSSRR